MKFNLGDSEATHRFPVWRDRANFIFSAYLGNVGGVHQWEQLWEEKLDTQKLIVCCIPFFAYGIALGDEVETDANFTFKRVTNRSGHTTFRVWLGGQEKIKLDSITNELAAMNLPIEWSSVNLLAVSAPDEIAAQSLVDYLFSRQQRGLLEYELAHAIEQVDLPKFVSRI